MSTADRLGSREGSSRAGWREPVGCVELAMTHRSASYLLAPGKRGLPATFPWHLFSRPTPFAVGRKLASFSCPIPPLSVLSHSMPMINTTGKLASFWRFSLTTGFLRSDSLATILPPLATRHSPLPPTTLPHWLLPATDHPIAKNRTGPISTNGLYIQYVTEPGDSCGEINPLFLARRRRTLDHSLVAGGAQRQSLQACLPDGHTAQCLFSACSP